jgi:putative transposase
MTRPKRIEFAGAWYHVMGCGIGQRSVFPSDSCRQLYLELMRETHTLFNVEYHAYCLLNQGYHLIVRTREANLASIMQHINGVYTQRHNRIQRKNGPLFHDRYRAILIDAGIYLARLSRYVHRRPLEAQHCPVLSNYRWSSYPVYLAQAYQPEWLYCAQVFSGFGKQEYRSRYKVFVERGVDKELDIFYSSFRHSAILGADAARRDEAIRVIGSMSRKSATNVIGVPHPYPMEDILSTVAQYFCVEKEVLFVDGRGKRNLPRALAIFLCRDLGRYALNDIVDCFGVSSCSAISMSVQRIKIQIGNNSKIARATREIRARLTSTNNKQFIAVNR